MAVTPSQMTELGTPAPPFELPAVNPAVDKAGAEMRRLDDYAEAPVLVVVFTCNHCPYAVHIEDALLRVARAYQPRGVQFVAISSNDPVQYPADSPERMAQRAEEKDYPFPYLFDASQEVARAYGAECTPDFFVYDTDRRLAYRGRFDATRPHGGTPTGDDLRAALDELLDTGTVTGDQYPSIGCNIKWRR